LQKAVDRDSDRSSIATLKNLIETDLATLWVDEQYKSAAITTQEVYPTGLKSCVVRVAGGELKTFVYGLDLMTEYAKITGCNMIEIYGREGWAKALKGFDKSHVVMSKRIL
tara:strand:- start:1555 stop:1887 length:333 start_codon:yes stop_codon:yes gene_type:complete